MKWNQTLDTFMEFILLKTGLVSTKVATGKNLGAAGEVVLLVNNNKIGPFGTDAEEKFLKYKTISLI